MIQLNILGRIKNLLRRISSINDSAESKHSDESKTHIIIQYLFIRGPSILAIFLIGYIMGNEL